MPAMNRWAWLIAGAMLLVGSTGCSSFDADYKRGLTAADHSATIEGPWEGRWESHAGHGGGSLRCVLTKTGADTYFLRFRAGYWGIFQADEETLLRAAPGSTPTALKATGESDLGYLKGGTYRYEATITPNKFDATYQSAYDRGVFTMTRPVPE
jgi:hypothetical protein